MKTVWATVQSWMMPQPPKVRKPRRPPGPRGPMKAHAEYTMEQAMRDIDTGKARKKKRETN
jgi:hypothetical protein